MIRGARDVLILWGIVINSPDLFEDDSEISEISEPS